MAGPARAASARIRRSRCPLGRGTCPSAATRSGTVRWSTQGGEPASIRVRRLHGRVPRQPAGHGGHQWLRQRLHPRHRNPHRSRLRQRGHPLHRGLMGQQHPSMAPATCAPGEKQGRGLGSALVVLSATAGGRRPGWPTAKAPWGLSPPQPPPTRTGKARSRCSSIPPTPPSASRPSRTRCRRRGPTRRSSRAERTPVGADTASAGGLVTPSPRPRADPTSARGVDGRRPWRPVLLR